MRSRDALPAALLLLLAANAGANEIFRCTAGGSVTYQQEPCSAAGAGGTVNIPTTYPDYTVERDRLMQREAALDARLLKRLEIDAAERIARDDRIARERTLQALLERERAEQSPAYVVARPLRHNLRRAWPIAIR